MEVKAIPEKVADAVKVIGEFCESQVHCGHCPFEKKEYQSNKECMFNNYMPQIVASRIATQIIYTIN